LDGSLGGARAPEPCRRAGELFDYPLTDYARGIDLKARAPIEVIPLADG
jgi:hypothetical protein